MELDLSWSKECIISEISRTFRIYDPKTDLVEYKVVTQTTGATVQTHIAKLYIPVANLSINDNINFLENIKQVFKRTISWNKYRSEITTQTNLDYLIDPTLRNINWLFVLSFKNGDDDPTRNSFDEFYMPLLEIKYLNALIDKKHFLISLWETNKKRMKNLFKCQEIIAIRQETY